jgi:protein-tyrosine phosphatase
VRVGPTFERFPVPDRGVPTSTEAAHSLWKVICTKIPDGRSAGIHCRADIGRSGLVTGNVLLQLGVSEAAAWRAASRI